MIAVYCHVSDTPGESLLDYRNRHRVLLDRCLDCGGKRRNVDLKLIFVEKRRAQLGSWVLRLDAGRRLRVDR